MNLRTNQTELISIYKDRSEETIQNEAQRKKGMEKEKDRVE